MAIDSRFKALVQRAKVARLATVDSQGAPHVVPVVFVFDGSKFFIPIDEKKKRVGPEELRRVKNIRGNSNVCLLIDNYEDDWSKLSFLMIHGIALLQSGGENDVTMRRAYDRLIRKYPQYQRVGLTDLWIVINPKRIVSWTNS
ncbi:MAG: TIGR03668 family PPOX class F420-dependent oxidoreductase [Nitrososphaera sp.]